MKDIFGREKESQQKQIINHIRLSVWLIHKINVVYVMIIELITPGYTA